MRVKKLSLAGFRNLEELEITPGRAVNVIWGDNAQGKTNLLESIWLFSGSRSFRNAKDSELIAFGREYARLDLQFYAGGRTQTASIRLGDQLKQGTLNEIKLGSLSALSGVFQVVVFSPDHLDLVKREPQRRRRLIDDSLCQAYPKYAKVLENYEKILRQRGFVLKDAQAQAQPQLLEMLEIWDGSLVEYGGYLTWMRARYVKKLAQLARENYTGISGGRERFDCRYRSSCGRLPKDPQREEVTALVKKAVQASRDQDIRLGMTHMGPHRDDMEILVNDKPVRTFGSQGQQRSCVLALKLAESRILEEGSGEPPVVLLDDVMSELDEGRRGYLLNQLKHRQIFITGCDASVSGELRGGKVFHVECGRITEKPAAKGKTRRKV